MPYPNLARLLAVSAFTLSANALSTVPLSAAPPPVRQAAAPAFTAAGRCAALTAAAGPRGCFRSRVAKDGHNDGHGGPHGAPSSPGAGDPPGPPDGFHGRQGSTIDPNGGGPS